MKEQQIAKTIIFGFTILMALLLILTAVVMLLWNAFAPELFGGPPLRYWQAVGLLLVLHILLRGVPIYGIEMRRSGKHQPWKRLHKS